MLLKHFIFLITAIIWIADAARILGIFPYPSYSHQVFQYIKYITKSYLEKIFINFDLSNSQSIKFYMKIF